MTDNKDALSALDKLVDYFQGKSTGDTQASDAKANYELVKSALTLPDAQGWRPSEDDRNKGLDALNSLPDDSIDAGTYNLIYQAMGFPLKKFPSPPETDGGKL